jgi:hypothetical protein
MVIEKLEIFASCEAIIKINSGTVSLFSDGNGELISSLSTNSIFIGDND